MNIDDVLARSCGLPLSNSIPSVSKNRVSPKMLVTSSPILVSEVSTYVVIPLRLVAVPLLNISDSSSAIDDGIFPGIIVVGGMSRSFMCHVIHTWYKF